jgi:hypothetical protein
LYFSCFSCLSSFCVINHEVFYRSVQQGWTRCCCAGRDLPGGIRTIMVGARSMKCTQIMLTDSRKSPRTQC